MLSCWQHDRDSEEEPMVHNQKIRQFRDIFEPALQIRVFVWIAMTSFIAYAVEGIERTMKMVKKRVRRCCVQLPQPVGFLLGPSQRSVEI